MKSNFLLEPRTENAVRKYRYLLVLTWIIGGFTSAYGIRQSIKDDPGSALIDASLHPEIMFWVVCAFFGIVCTIASMIYGLPAFYILKRLESLLSKARLQGHFKLSQQIEISKLKKLFVYQLALNVLVFFTVENYRLTSFLKDQGDKDLGEHGSKAFYIVNHINSYLNWFTAPFEKSMPLLYLIMLLAFVRFSKTSDLLKEEMEHTV